MSTRPEPLPQFLDAPLPRREALKLIAGTAVTAGLAGCGVSPGFESAPTIRTNLLMLRGRVRNLTGRDRERLRVIAGLLDPAHLQRVSGGPEHPLSRHPPARTAAA